MSVLWGSSMVERPIVNRVVVGSTPTPTAKLAGLAERQLRLAVDQLSSGYGGSSPSPSTNWGCSLMRERPPCKRSDVGLNPTNSTKQAELVQWQNAFLPSRSRGFDSRTRFHGDGRPIVRTSGCGPENRGSTPRRHTIS